MCLHSDVERRVSPISRVGKNEKVDTLSDVSA